jgi:haloacetate dehalogenase
MTFDTFSREIVDVAAGRVFIRRAGRGPAVLLLHGYPETSLAWRKVAPELASEFTVIAADLPGYGDSILSDDALEDGRNSKRTMGRALADVMSELGISQFAVVGHDRGARVAYRLALDQPERIHAVAVLDVIPILEMAGRLTYEAARQMGHWFWLAQSSTVPETLIGRDPDLYVRHIIDEWGGSDFMERETVDEYIRCMRKPEVLRTMGAEYRADRLDLEHDQADWRAARRIACPLLAVLGEGRFDRAVWRSTRYLEQLGRSR